MLRRTPMSRGGFRRAEYVRPPPAPLRPVERSGVMARIGQEVAPQPKENVAVSESYRRLVRKLPCARCGIVGFSQFCHSDEGKGLGLKTDDRRGWPGCGPHGGEPGCHWLVGTSGRLPRHERRAFEAAAGQRTRATIIGMNLWPKNLPLWPEEPFPADGSA